MDDKVYTFDADSDKDGRPVLHDDSGGRMHWIENPMTSLCTTWTSFFPPKRTADREESVGGPLNRNR